MNLYLVHSRYGVMGVFSSREKADQHVRDLGERTGAVTVMERKLDPIYAPMGPCGNCGHRAEDHDEHGACTLCICGAARRRQGGEP